MEQVRLRQSSPDKCRELVLSIIARSADSSDLAPALPFRPGKTEIQTALDLLESFYFFPNSGNLGDALIAEAEYQLFDRNAFNYRVYDDFGNRDSLPPGEPFNLVYGGGGLFTCYWEYENVLQVFSRRNLRQCLILASSFYRCDDLMALLDQHFTVFCRERKSYEYCLASNKRASFILADDMAFGLELESFSAFDKKKALKVASSMSDADLIFLLVVIWAKYQQTLSRLQRQLIANTIIKNGLRLGFFLRTDEEKATDSSVKNTVDVAGFAGSSCADPGITRLLSGMFYGAINTVDIVVTDRLHVGIMSAILGKQVFLIDNSYGKLSGVYHNSMTGMPNVRFVQSVSSLRVSSLPTMRPTADLSFLASGKPDLSDFVRAYFSRAKIDNPLNNSMWR